MTKSCRLAFAVMLTYIHAGPAAALPGIDFTEIVAFLAEIESMPLVSGLMGAVTCLLVFKFVSATLTVVF